MAGSGSDGGAVIAVTGAAGFIGAAYCRRLAARGRVTLCFVHRLSKANDDGIAIDLAQANVDRLAGALDGVSAVVHLAGRAHVQDDTAPDVVGAYRAANVEATGRLARAAVAVGVRRFVFASTVKVNGEATPRGRPFWPGDAPAPHDAYARSKLAAETTLADIVKGTSTTPIILRLPLVYGCGARGNFRRLVDAVAARRRLPLGAIDNRRSLLGLPNLLDALDAALDAPQAVSGTHFVADANAVSTPELVRAIAAALGIEPRIVNVPPLALRVAAALSGHQASVARLTESLEVDASSFIAATGWRPRPFAIDAAMVAPPQATEHSGI